MSYLEACTGSAKAQVDVRFCLVGVGGQGVLLAADIVAHVGVALGLDVKKAEVHGMSQRGGSVVSHVRWGTRVYSPLIEKGTASYLVGFERLEGLRHLAMLAEDGRLIMSNHRIVPVTVTCGGGAYPGEEIERRLFRAAGAEPLWVPSVSTARALGMARAHNMVLLGALAACAGGVEAPWEAEIAQPVPIGSLEHNLAAFRAGWAHLSGRGEGAE